MYSKSAHHVECVDGGLEFDALLLQVLDLMLALCCSLFQLARLPIRAPKLPTRRIHLIRQIESVLFVHKSAQYMSEFEDNEAHISHIKLYFKQNAFLFNNYCIVEY